MSRLDRPHEFVEDVADYSMCLCGVPALTHHRVEPDDDPLDPEDREAMGDLIAASRRGIGSIHMFGTASSITREEAERG